MYGVTFAKYYTLLCQELLYLVPTARYSRYCKLFNDYIPVIFPYIQYFVLQRKMTFDFTSIVRSEKTY